MSEPEEDLPFTERGDFVSSSLDSTISDFSDERFGLSTVTENHLGYYCSLRRHESSKNSTFDGFVSYSSTMPEESLELPNEIKYFHRASEAKVLQYKTLLERVNRAHVEYKMSEFLVGCAKESSKKMLLQVRTRVQNVWANSAVQKHVKLESSDRENCNILGLTNEQITNLKQTVLSPLEKIECIKHMNETVKHKVKKLKKQEQILIGSHYSRRQQKEPVEDEILIDAHKDYQQILEVISNKVESGLHLLNDINETILQLSQLKGGSDSELLEVSHDLICKKVKFCSSSISKLRLQIDLKMYGDLKFQRALDDYGNTIKTIVKDTSSKLSGLELSLAEYEGKKNKSQTYKTIVLEYCKAKNELQHAHQILSIFSSDSPALGSHKM